jgi:hypothetical protein
MICFESQYGDSGGISWDVGAIHTGQWTGVLLREVLADAGLDLERYLCSGRDEEYCHCQFAAVDGENWMSGLLRISQGYGIILSLFLQVWRPPFPSTRPWLRKVAEVAAFVC